LPAFPAHWDSTPVRSDGFKFLQGLTGAMASFVNQAMTSLWTSGKGLLGIDPQKSFWISRTGDLFWHVFFWIFLDFRGQK
jgi:hypothetical protein